MGKPYDAEALGQWRGKCFHLMTSSCIILHPGKFQVMIRTYHPNLVENIFLYDELNLSDNVSNLSLRGQQMSGPDSSSG